MKLIRLIRESHPEICNIYTRGSCLNFFLILKEIYPQAIGYYNNDHVITNIDGVFYDITGEIKNTENYMKGITTEFTNKNKIIKQLLGHVYKNESSKQKSG